ncbi:MAG TPA: LemA family protein [Longimicrobiales bacterium]
MGTVVLIILAVLAVAAIVLYNSLIRSRNRVKQAYSGIEVQLTQRYALIPKLVETVRQYMTHERSLLEDIVRLRSEAMQGGTEAEKNRADGELTRALGQLRVSVENYPQLKASSNFVQLQRSLNEVEEQLAAARRSFNSAATDYNNRVQTFPSSLVAQAMNFRTRSMYQAEAHERADVDMKQLFNA